MAKKQKSNKRKWWFELIKKITKIKYKKPEFVYLGEEVDKGALILSNHEGTDSPMSLEIYSGKNIRFWGTYNMNEGLVKMYKYQTKVYYHEKKHWNLFGARMFCLLASPLTNLFYKGLNLISTYPDIRFFKTIKESKQAVLNGENIVVFPEKSTNGYQAELEGFYGGSVLFAECCLKEGIDLPVYVSYYNKKKRIYLFDSPVKYSVLKEKYGDKDEIAKVLCDRCNEIGRMTEDGSYKTIEKENKEIA